MSRKKRQEETGSWMDTYGDMVTLLLCFFVLLYAISAIDQTKWNNLVRSFNPDAVELLESTIAQASDDTTMTEKKIPKNFDDLYNNLRKEINDKQLTAEITVQKGEGFTFISFKDKIFFDGDSYVLLNGGQKILDDFAMILAPFSEDIKQIEVLGHTADVPERRTVSNDRFLSSNRATAVLVYLQEKNILAPSKLVSSGYGQYWPVSDNATPEGRAENRRVELLITKVGSEDRDLEAFYREIQANEGQEETEEATAEGTAQP